MFNLICSFIAALPAVPFTFALLSLLYFTPSTIGFAAIIVLILYCLEMVSTPSPYLGQLVKECAEYLETCLEQGHHHTVSILLRIFLKSNHAILAAIFGLALCPTLVASALLAMLGFTTALDAVVYLPLAGVVPMLGWKTGKTIYPFLRDMVLLPFVLAYLTTCAVVRCVALTCERFNIAISNFHQRNAAKFYQDHMTSQHCSQGHWNCTERNHFPNPSGYPHPLCSYQQSWEFPLAAVIPYWGDRVVYFRHEQHIRQLLLELDWTMCRGANRHLYVTPADVQYEYRMGCPIPLQPPVWSRAPTYY